MDPFEKITASEVIKAQEAWVAAVIAQDVESLLALYDFGSPDEPLSLNRRSPMKFGRTRLAHVLTLSEGTRTTRMTMAFSTGVGNVWNSKVKWGPF
ncbi:MAG: hypothetical protein MK080_04940 [Opitutales bacterium]|nr:hypothetical protein [Opitutales bacterium]NRA27765.1 hypothetical protein [Opitutales bacterium]